jgi:hypothetical protein
VIDAYLSEVAALLAGPAGARRQILAELRDGLAAAVEACQRDGAGPAEAAQRAVAEFGPPAEVAAGFAPELAARQARLVGVGLIAGGPLVGTLWLAALGTWPVVLFTGRLARGWAAAPLYGLILAIGIPAAVLAVVASGRLERWQPDLPRLAPGAAAVGAAACVAGDLALLAMFAVSTSSIADTSWPVLWVAAPLASLFRLAAAGRGARRCLAVRGVVRRTRESLAA